MTLAPPPGQPALVPAQATSDAQLARLWLQSQASANTRAAYARDLVSFLTAVGATVELDQAGQVVAIVGGTPLPQITVQQVVDWSVQLEQRGLAESSRKRKLSTIKSLLTYGQRLGYLPFNAGAAIKLRRPKNTIGERILSEEEVQRMIAAEPEGRNHVLILLLYASGGRVSEVCGLRWRDCQQQKRGGQITIYGKGGKTRHVLLKAETYLELLSLKGDAGADDPVFGSRKGTGPLSRQQAWRIVRAAAVRVGIAAEVSPHWMRHAHGSHALDNGAPVHLVQATLGHASLETTTGYTHARPSDSSARYLPL